MHKNQVGFQNEFLNKSYVTVSIVLKFPTIILYFSERSFAQQLTINVYSNLFL